LFTESGRSWVWTGSTWDSPSAQPFVAPGLVLLANQNVTASSGFAIDNVFTPLYENYRIIVRADDASASNSVPMRMQFRKAGSTISATNYRFSIFYLDMLSSTSGDFTRGNGEANMALMQIGGDPSVSSYLSMDVYNPQVSTLKTGVTLQAYSAYSSNNNAVSLFGSGTYSAVDTFDGVFILSSSGNWTGNIKIYGYRS
jgi:hypothetical protein